MMENCFTGCCRDYSCFCWHILPVNRWDMGMDWQFLSLAVFWGQGNVQLYVGQPLCCPVFLQQEKYA